MKDRVGDRVGDLVDRYPLTTLYILVVITIITLLSRWKV